jgi:hypothetical protein
MTTSAGSISQNSLADRADRRLVWAAAFFTIAVVLHGLDHARRGADSLNLDVFWAGTSAVALEVGVVVLVCQRHRLAPLAAAVTGFSLAAGYVLVHFLPARGWLSDSLTSAADVSRLSWIAASLEVVAATALGLAGLAALRDRGGLASAAHPRSDQRPVRDALAHPAVVAMALGNAVILAVSAVQLSRG